MKAVLVAAAFLTRVPVPVVAGAADVADAARWFSLVGGAIGGAAALIAWVLVDVIALPPAFTAIVLVGLGAWVTGAIHLDGLADTADGFGGGRNRDEVLRIMRDPAIGSFGATALVIVIGTKVAALTALLDRGAALPFLVAAPALSRWTISLLGTWLPYARAEGGVGEAATRQRPTGLVVSTVIAAFIAVTALRMEALATAATALLTAAWVGRTARRRIGGVTGDVFGASLELTETAVLASGVLVTGPA